MLNLKISVNLIRKHVTNLFSFPKKRKGNPSKDTELLFHKKKKKITTSSKILIFFLQIFFLPYRPIDQNQIYRKKIEVMRSLPVPNNQKQFFFRFFVFMNRKYQ